MPASRLSREQRRVWNWSVGLSKIHLDRFIADNRPIVNCRSYFTRPKICGWVNWRRPGSVHVVVIDDGGHPTALEHHPPPPIVITDGPWRWRLAVDPVLVTPSIEMRGRALPDG